MARKMTEWPFQARADYQNLSANLGGEKKVQMVVGYG